MFFAPPKQRLQLFLLFLLCATAFLVRVWGISRFHFWDEMVYLQNAQVICCGKSNYSELDFRPPLLSLIFAGVFLVWNSIYAACIVTAFLNALGPVFLFLAGRRLVGRLPAAIAALLLAFSPFFIGIFPDGFVSDNTGNSLLTDSPALTLALLALWLLLRALDGESTARFAWAGIALAATILMRFGSLPTICILLLLPLAAKRRSRALIACVAGLLIGMAPYLCWSRLHFGSFFFTLRSGWTGVVDEGEPFFFYLRNCAAIFTPAAILGLVLNAASSLWRLLRAIPSRLRIPAALSGPSPLVLEAFLWLWLVVDFVFFSAMPHKEPRYVLPLAPPFLLLAGSGLALLCAPSSKSLRRIGALLVAALLVFTFLPARERLSESFIDPGAPQEELASEFLQSSFPSGTGLYMNFNYPAFGFYTNSPIHELPADGAALYQDISNIPPGGLLIVYRESEGEVWAPDIAWMDANPNFQRLRDFSTFVIYRRVPWL
ncbi:MAG: glycosyltransferase family 39 protein [Terracidiphilus sp.]|jgi:4-amino-4-deoxy-L-arabinose transferase-like glycosyltransferase